MVAQSEHNVLVQSLGRLQQIRDNLSQAEHDEQRELETLERSGVLSNTKQLEIRNAYLETRVELYNETFQIENDLLIRLAQTPAKPTPEEITAMARQVGLAKLLRERRAVFLSSSDCWTSCTECVTSCVECVSSCTECVVSSRCTAQSSPIGIGLSST